MNTIVPHPMANRVPALQAPARSALQQLSFQVTADNGQVHVQPSLGACTPPPMLDRSSIPTGARGVQMRNRKRYIEVTCGSSVVKIYRTAWRDKKRRKQYTSHTLIYHELDGSRFLRRREKRSLKMDALDLASQVAIRLANNETLMLHFAPDDRARWLACCKSAAEIRRDPVTLVSERVDFEKKRPAGVTDDELLKCWQENHPAGIDERHIPKIVEDLLAKREMSTKYRRNLSKMLELFAAKFDCPLSALQAREIDDWLDGLKKGLRTRHNYRSALLNLANFAKARGYLREDWKLLDLPPVGLVSDPEPKPIKINTYTSDELVKLLNKAESYKAGMKLVPLIAITAFAGVRHGEMNEEKIEHLDWRHFDWETKRIYIEGGVAKRTSRQDGDGRTVDMPDNLVAWLEPYRRPSGKVVPLVNTSNALCRLRKKAGITGPKKNALRKSFITYKLALGSGMDKVATQAGNSERTIRKHYKGAEHTRLREEAQRWFSIMPTRADVLPLWKAAAAAAAAKT